MVWFYYCFRSEVMAWAEQLPYNNCTHSQDASIETWLLLLSGQALVTKHLDLNPLPVQSLFQLLIDIPRTEVCNQNNCLHCCNCKPIMRNQNHTSCKKDRLCRRYKHYLKVLFVYCSVTAGTAGGVSLPPRSKSTNSKPSKPQTRTYKPTGHKTSSDTSLVTSTRKGQAAATAISR